MQHVQKLVAQNQLLLQKLNNGTADQQEIRKQLSVITNQRIDSSVEVRLPFYTDFGRNIHLGKNIFINSGVMMTDLGGVYIGNNVLIGPKVTIATVNHPLNPQDRHHVDLKPVYIRQNAWIGANAVIVPGITISENAVVAAGSVVTHNVPKDTMVAGVPARITKLLK
ncbi:sugar O-acetyltransferase [Limosilactobacillus sp. WF-MT5-A]|uniref:DapH/DapD/GlmU-related protein n=1 Tax=Limosilactobacillus agrestis TaxID=2759748 RepID=UPI0015F89261|nr:DapH/DapD/GlmU-related protein [Limosilactobacillus agrestis]MBB1099601.1 sugar O-acetyltransferase [Limosilactobacillus agrestis]MCD7127231.1 sugar O-acetyltransferase [Limosilactobacillus agrestis]